jgi:hypothetical protein
MQKEAVTLLVGGPWAPPTTASGGELIMAVLGWHGFGVVLETATAQEQIGIGVRPVKDRRAATDGAQRGHFVVRV